MKPKTNLLHWPKGKYVPSHSTNLEATFRKERERLAQEKQGWRVGMTPRSNVRAI